MTFKKIFSVLCFFCLPLLVLSAHAADPIVAKVQQRYDNMKSMRANFTQVLLHKESGGKDTRSGVLHFKKPLLVHWETKEPAPELLLVTPERIWNAFPDEDLAYKYPSALAQDSASLVRVITGQTRLDQDFSIEMKGADSAFGGLTKIILYPKEMTQSLTEAVLWVDPANGFIKGIRIIDFYYNENEIRFTEQEADLTLSDALFEYTPPANFKVEDRTKNGAVGNQLLQ